jgi:hypothetical protein
MAGKEEERGGWCSCVIVIRSRRGGGREMNPGGRQLTASDIVIDLI